MRVVTVTAEAFGPFSGEQLRFAPGMTVICGPNESGKSSWHAATYAALCGLRRARGAPRKADQEFAARHRPWDESGWRVRATVELADSRTLEFRQDLDSQVDCSVRDTLLGTDLSGELIHDGSPDGAKLFGLTREVLVPTVCVRQADILGVLDDPAALQEHLQRAAATGGADATAEQALAGLRRFQREHVGQDRRNATRPLRQAIDAVEDARARLAGVESDQEEYLQLARDRDAAKQRAERAHAELCRVDAALAARRLSEAEERVASIRELAKRFPDGPPDLPDDDTVQPARVASALASWTHRPSPPPTLEGPSARALEDQLAGLPSPPEGDTEVAEEVAAAHDAWRQARQRVELHADATADWADEESTQAPEGVSPGQLRAVADALEIPVRAEEPAPRSPGVRTTDRRRRGVLLVMALIAALAGVGLWIADVALPGALVIVAAAAAAATALRTADREHDDTQTLAREAVEQATAEHARQRHADAIARVEGWAVPADPQWLRDRAAALEHHERLAATRRRQQAVREEHQSSAAAAAERLRAALDDRGAAVDGDVGSAFDAYETACRERARQAAQSARADDLHARIESRRALEARAAEQLGQRHAAVEELAAAAQAVGITETPHGQDPQTLADSLEAWQREREIGREAAFEQRHAWQRLQGLLAGDTVEAVETAVQRLQEERAIAGEVEPAPLPSSDEDAASVRRASEQALRQAEREVAALDGQLADKSGSVASVAEAEEGLARAEAELARVRRLGRTLTTTVEFLQAARERVHRDIAPRLKQSLDGRLPVVTDGRYLETRVDPATLRVQVRASSGEWRDAARLSHGTAEQVYLLLRVAMAEHLVTTAEPVPLLLDDVTVQADRQRTQAMLTLLHKVSAERQVVVFTQEEEVRAWAADHLTAPDHALVDLAPVTAG